jgi:hypothetical protein
MSSSRVEMGVGLGLPSICPSTTSLDPTSPIPPQGPVGSVPLLQRYYEKAPNSPGPSRFLAVSGTVVRAPPSLPAMRAAHGGPGPFLRRRPRRLLTTETRRPPRFLAAPHACMPRASPPAGPLIPGHTGKRYCLPCGKLRRLPRRISFRGSITRPIGSLCTLRSRGRPRSTQHSVPAGGQPLPGRVTTCRVRSEGFCLCFLHRHPPPPGLAWRNFRGNVFTQGERSPGPAAPSEGGLSDDQSSCSFCSV